MTDEARQMRNEYYRQWRQKNKGKTKKYQAQYWERQAELRRQKGVKENDGFEAVQN